MSVRPLNKRFALIVALYNCRKRDNSVHQYTIKVQKKINNLKSRKFEDYFMRNH